MKLKQSISVQQIASLINARVLGNGETLISGINEIHKVVAGDLSFVDHPKYYEKCIESAASAVLINNEVASDKPLIISEDPIRDYNFLVKHFQPEIFTYPLENEAVNIHPSAKIYQGVHISKNCSVGANSIIYPGVVIYDNVHIGENVILHANCIIGSDAFYFNKRTNGYLKLRSSGSVYIDDKVEIGSACTIDRGVSGKTIIGEGTKLDNQVHVGHGVEIGKNCLIAAQVGIAGKTIIKDGVTLWGQVGVNKDITIGENAEVFAQSGIAKSLTGNKSYFGSPALPAKEQMRILAYTKRLPEIWKRLIQKK